MYNTVLDMEGLRRGRKMTEGLSAIISATFASFYYAMGLSLFIAVHPSGLALRGSR